MIKFQAPQIKNLTEAEKACLHEWEIAKDPTVRFQNNFYTLRRHELLQEYFEDLNTTTSPDEEKEAGEKLEFHLNYLRQMYTRDIELLFELNMMMNNIFLPWKVTVVPPNITA